MTRIKKTLVAAFLAGTVMAGIAVVGTGSDSAVLADRIIPPGTICGMCYVP
ncbi:hypothetical protein [Streptomyces sp. NPDC026673]|uniref:hypothetical protein n=1 Tax=Streptomyces sp. NPDC026673 TaxID=3155724 RepID=UPI0033F07271